MKISGICLMILVCAVALVPGVVAQNVDNTGNGYTVRPAYNLNLPSAIHPMSSGMITLGESDYYFRYVSPGTTAVVPDLNWGDTADSLTLSISTPNGSLGPFNDASDGIDNARIYLHISNPSGLPSGIWEFRIYGEQVSGSQSYTFTV
jgi:hypothetical protein